jgi:hypothetical protein
LWFPTQPHIAPPFNTAGERMLQFNLRTLMLLMVGAAVVCWALFASPHWPGFVAILLAYFLLPVVVASGIVFHRGYWQAFFVGMAPWTFVAFLWAIMVVLSSGIDFLDPSDFDVTQNNDAWGVIVAKLYYAAPLAVCLVCGLVSVGVRAWAQLARRSRAASQTSRQQGDDRQVVVAEVPPT